MTQEEFHKRYQYNPNTDCLGEGGFGKVYKAYDNHRDRYVAIKMAEVKPHLEEVRLRKEVETISKLPSHPNIAYYEECYTFSTFAGEYDFGVLQYYEQGNLQQLLTDKELTYAQKDSLLKQILEGIAFLHSQGIIHRDLKPQNILIVNRNGEYIPKITDFGISKKLDINKSSVFTNSLAGAGTLSFASPEQLCGQTIRKNTDLWSFGVIACWIFTGKLPFNTGAQAITSEAGRIELFKQITAGEATAIIQQLPITWQKVVKQCIVVDVEKRIGGAEKCLELLGEKMKTEDLHKQTVVSNQPTVTYFEGTRVGEKISTSPTEPLIDIDGNSYRTVRIGNQVWMAENLKVNRYRNGDPITNIKNDNDWAKLKTGAWCNYKNDIKYDSIYSKLYNCYAVDDERGLAPNGWHVATDKEWTELVDYLGGEYIAGGKLKSESTLFWKSPNKSASNKSGFSALPGGYRSNYSGLFSGAFKDIVRGGFWWSAKCKHSYALCRFLYFDNSYVSISKVDLSFGLSVRCVRDN